MARRRARDFNEEEPQDIQEDPGGEELVENYEGLAEDADIKPEGDDLPVLQRTLSEIESSQETLTDMQAIVKKAFPEVPDEAKSTETVTHKVSQSVYHKKTLQNLQVARVYPEAFMSMIRLDVKRAYRFADRKRPFDVVAHVENAYTHISMGLEGRARLELAEFGGASREAQKQGGLSGLLGGGT